MTNSNTRGPAMVTAAVVLSGLILLTQVSQVLCAPAGLRHASESSGSGSHWEHRSGHESDEHESDDSDEGDHMMRTFQRTEYDSQHITFTSFSRTTSGGSREHNEVKFDLREVGDSPMRFRIQYRSRSSDGRAALNARVTFKALVEYRAASENDSLEGWAPESRVVRRVRLDPRGWGDISAPVITALPSGGHLYQFSVAYTGSNAAAPGNSTNSSGEGQPLRVTLTVFVADAAYTAPDNSSYGPAEAKIDVQIDNYGNAEAGTYLALEAAVQTGSPRFRRDDAGEADHEGRLQISSPADGLVAALRWAKSVTADGESAAVVASSFRTAQSDTGDDEEEEGGESAQATRFTFKKQLPIASISWDPSLSVVEASGGVSSNSIAALPLLLLVAAGVALRAAF